MLQGPILLGIGFLLGGLLFVLAVWVLLRFVPRRHPALQETLQPAFVQIDPHEDAVLVVEVGGKIRYVNGPLREWFELVEGELPNIERLARRVRPSESFLELCATEGQARFSINGKLVDALSYRVPGAVPGVLVAIRRSENTMRLTPAQQGDAIPGVALKTVTEFGQAIATSLSLEDTVESTLVNVERLVASDFLEVKVWDDSTKSLVPYRMSDATGAARTLQREKLSQFGEYAGYLVAQRKELFIPDTRTFANVKYDPFGSRVPPMGS
jgi:hypothetical protein